MKLIIKLMLSLVVIIISGCSGNQPNNNGSSIIGTHDKMNKSNAITKSLPTLMVIPSDGLLNAMGCLSKVENQGVTKYVRNYNEAFIKDIDLTFAIAAIEEEFAKKGYPLENLEQQLKMIANENALDNAEGVSRDLRTELLNTARPDYIIEVEYETKVSTRSRNLDKSLTYIVKCLDVYTNKTVAAVTRADIGKGSGEFKVASLIKSDFPESMNEFQTTIAKHFAVILTNGIEITLRVSVLDQAKIAMDDYCGEEEISEQIINWLKANTINSTYKMVKNTNTEIRFTNVRIHTSDESGHSYTAYDFAKDLRKALQNGCSLDLANKTQSIGDAYLQIEGIN